MDSNFSDVKKKLNDYESHYQINVDKKQQHGSVKMDAFNVLLCVAN